MDFIEVSGKNVDDALTNALVKLETTSDNVEYEVIEKGSSGLFGIFNTKPAVIRVSKKTETEIEAQKEVEKITERVVEKSVDNNEKKSDKAHKSSDSSIVEKSENKTKFTTVMPKEEVEKRIKTFLSDMFKSMGMEVNIDISFDDPDCVNVNLSGENMGVLIGKRGQTLDSIQYLTSLVVNKGKDKYVRIKIDTEDYRKRRKETLESLAKNIAYKVKRSRRPVSLEPMNPYERRIIHSALQNDKFVSTRSEGDEPFRHVVVFLDREKSAK